MHLQAESTEKKSYLRATEFRAERGWVSYIFTAFSFWIFSDPPWTHISPWNKCIQSYSQTFFLVDVIYLDFSKAFHTVSHSILLEKLAAHGFDRCTLCWVKTGWLAEPRE